MADQKISELTALTGANAADDDVLAIVDTSAVETKKITRSELFKDTPAIGIGITSPAQLLHVQEGGTGNGTIRVGGGAGLEISHDNSGNTTQRIDSLYRTTSAGANLQLRTGILTVHTGTSSTEAMRIDSSGRAIIPAGVTLGTAAGVYNAANTLDDYEEGTFTPLITGSASNPSSTANASNLGFYTKIGRQVTVCFRVDYSSVSGGSGNFEISGLPFTSNSNSYFRSSGNISFFRGVTHGGNRLAPHALANDTKFIFYKLANASEFDDVILTSALSSSITIHGFYTYFTD